jgi:multidrug transporter EmrE-like cation transporter
VGQFKQTLEQTLATARQDLDNLKKTYDEDLALRASVRYWGLQQKDHRSKSVGFGIVLAVVALFVMVIIIGYSFRFLDTSIQDIQVSRLVTATVLTTFGIWMVRVIANLFMSHMHLATDAQERRTMIHTYLALLRKGHGPKDDERQLILQTLFRPSTTDMVKNDHGPAQIVDLLNRMSPKGTGN